MPKGPQGQKRPADAIGCAVLVGRIATGEIDEDAKPKDRGKSGGYARAARLSKERRVEIARQASSERWRKEAVNE